MTLFIRTKDNRTLVDIEVPSNKFDIRSAINIEEYSKVLIHYVKNEPCKVDIFIKAIDEFSEIRGWLWEMYIHTLPKSRPTEEYCIMIRDEVKKRMKEVCTTFDLSFVED